MKKIIFGILFLGLATSDFCYAVPNRCSDKKMCVTFVGLPMLSLVVFLGLTIPTYFELEPDCVARQNRQFSLNPEVFQQVCSSKNLTLLGVRGGVREGGKLLCDLQCGKLNLNESIHARDATNVTTVSANITCSDGCSNLDNGGVVDLACYNYGSGMDCKMRYGRRYVPQQSDSFIQSAQRAKAQRSNTQKIDPRTRRHR